MRFYSLDLASTLSSQILSPWAVPRQVSNQGRHYSLGISLGRHSGHFIPQNVIIQCSASSLKREQSQVTNVTIVPWEGNEMLHSIATPPECLRVTCFSLSEAYIQVVCQLTFIASMVCCHTLRHKTNANQDWTSFKCVSDTVTLEAFSKVSSFDAASYSLLKE